MSAGQNLKFDTHSFGFECYDAGDMRVAYAQHSHHICINRIGRKKLHIDDRRPVVGALPGYAAFSGPVQIAWRTREGDQFNQVLHLERIFRERVVRCERSADRIFQAAPFAPGSPVVVVEVDDMPDAAGARSLEAVRIGSLTHFN